MSDGWVTVTGIDGPNGLDALAADLTRAAKVAPKETRKVVSKGLLNIKKDWRQRWTGYPHAPLLPYSITYDVKMSLHGKIDGEVGPDKDKKQGALGNLFEYGSVKNAPIPGGAPALRTEQPRFEKAMETLGLDLLGPKWR